MLSYFKLGERGTSVRTEVLAGCTTFLTLSYIIFVNPLILGGTGMDSGAVLVATCLAAAFGSLVMGLYANYPIALAPGMGLNAYFAAIAVGTLGLPWQVALGAVFCSGVLMLVLSVLPVREWVVNSIPRSQKVAIAAGIGFFLVIIGLRNAGVIVGSEATLVALGNLVQWPVILALLGFFGIVAFEHRKIPGAVLICILIVAGVGWLSGQSDPPASLLAAPPSLAPTFFQLDIAAAFEVGLLAIVFAFLMVDLFDTSGTLVAVLNEAGLADEDGKVPHLQRAPWSPTAPRPSLDRCSAPPLRPPTSRAPRVCARAAAPVSPPWSSPSCSLVRSCWLRWRPPSPATRPPRRSYSWAA